MSENMEMLAVVNRTRREKRPRLDYGERTPFSLRPKGRRRVLIPVWGYHIYEEQQKNG